MSFDKEFFEKLKMSGIEVGDTVVGEFNPELRKEVESFVRKVEEANVDAGRSQLHFD